MSRMLYLLRRNKLTYVSTRTSHNYPNLSKIKCEPASASPAFNFDAYGSHTPATPYWSCGGLQEDACFPHNSQNYGSATM